MEAKVVKCIRSIFPLKQAEKITRIGGMTNLNYKVEFKDITVVLRIPGEGTSSFISRKNEEENTRFAVKRGYHPKLLYFDIGSGIKVTEFIREGITLHSNSVTKEILSMVAKKISSLHSLGDTLSTEFFFDRELRRYLDLLRDKSKVLEIDSYCTISKVLLNKLKMYPSHVVICHNDLVPENFIKTSSDIFLLDWEYAGMNDPCWDIASLFSEWNLGSADRDFFLMNYLASSDDVLWWKEKILLYEIAQNILWFVWGLLRTQDGVCYESYAYDRLAKAIELFEKGKSIYAWDDDA